MPPPIGLGIYSNLQIAQGIYGKTLEQQRAFVCVSVCFCVDMSRAEQCDHISDTDM